MTQFFVYILASHSRVLYTGVTRNLLRRVYQHRIGGAVGFVGPSLADGRWRYGGTDGEIYYSIFYGRPRGMPAWGGTLPPDAIWTIVSYLQSLQPAKDTLSTTTW